MTDALFVYRDLGSHDTSAILPQLADLYGLVYNEPPYYEGPAEVTAFRARFEEQRKEAGFSLTSCSNGRELLGYLYGFTVKSRSTWWETLLTSIRPGESAERLQMDTAFVSELLVRSDVRRCGIGRTLHDRFLAPRTESQALLLVHPDAYVAQTAYARWGWRSVGYGEPFSGAGLYQTLVLSEPAGAVKRKR